MVPKRWLQNVCVFPGSRADRCRLAGAPPVEIERVIGEQQLVCMRGIRSHGFGVRFVVRFLLCAFAAGFTAGFAAGFAADFAAGFAAGFTARFAGALRAAAGLRRASGGSGAHCRISRMIDRSSG
ncbi:MAG: hypothetical protein IPK29_15635 [Betaproteobacteria bacterium]|nr:hypothetical protein [Betaproteobacteria bacterium]